MTLFTHLIFNTKQYMGQSKTYEIQNKLEHIYLYIFNIKRDNISNTNVLQVYSYTHNSTPIYHGITY